MEAVSIPAEKASIGFVKSPQPSCSELHLAAIPHNIPIGNPTYQVAIVPHNNAYSICVAQFVRVSYSDKWFYAYL